MNRFIMKFFLDALWHKINRMNSRFSGSFGVLGDYVGLLLWLFKAKVISASLLEELVSFLLTPKVNLMKVSCCCDEKFDDPLHQYGNFFNLTWFVIVIQQVIRMKLFPFLFFSFLQQKDSSSWKYSIQSQNFISKRVEVKIPKFVSQIYMGLIKSTKHHDSDSKSKYVTVHLTWNKILDFSIMIVIQVYNSPWLSSIGIRANFDPAPQCNLSWP